MNDISFKPNKYNYGLKTIITSVLSATLMMSMSATAQKVRWASADDPVVKELFAKEKMWGESNCSSQPGLKGKDGKEFLRCLVWTDTWLKRDGKWQIIAAQDVVVKCQVSRAGSGKDISR